METKVSSSFWWLKSSKSDTNILKTSENTNITNKTNTTRPESDISSSLAEYLEKERELQTSAGSNNEDVDIGSILEEINRLSAKSPLGPYENGGDRSIEDIMREAEKIYLESSKSFEQLSQRSKTSQNITDLLNSDKSDSTPTPKSISPLPLDDDQNLDDNDSYSDDFTDKFEERSQKSDVMSDVSQKSDVMSDVSQKSEHVTQSEKLSTKLEVSAPISNNMECSTKEPSLGIILNSEENLKSVPDAISKTPSNNIDINSKYSLDFEINSSKSASSIKNTQISTSAVVSHSNSKHSSISSEGSAVNKVVSVDFHKALGADVKTVIDVEEVTKKDNIIKMLIKDNHSLKDEVNSMHLQLEETRQFLEHTNASLRAQQLRSPEINVELENALEKLKDSKEMNTALQLQLDSTNKTHQILKNSYEDLMSSNRQIERRMNDLDTSLSKYKQELSNVTQQKEKLLENQTTVNKLLDIERLQIKALKIQTEKDTKCIMDLNRQIKEMERIIARKHPDSVSALIMAAKKEACDNTPTARKVLEDRIKTLEQEVLLRDAQNSKVFVDVQEKFNQMTLKYESHIDDLELHVNDLKTQLKRKLDTYDVYTQTVRGDQKIPEKDTNNQGVQTDSVKNNRFAASMKKPERVAEVKEETHLIATIRGLQTDLSNKEKVAVKLQREVDELKKTNRRLQKEREGSLKNLSEKKSEFKQYTDKLVREEKIMDPDNLEDELRVVKSERDKMKVQLCRIEGDYQALKAKRLQDLNTLQEAHEREISTYLSNITPLREQLEVQQISLTALQTQLVAAKEQLVIVTVERDHLNNRVDCGAERFPEHLNGNTDDNEVITLRKKICHLELKYEDREHRLRAIVHGLAQKNITNRSCEQCAARHQQLIGYKVELDQLIATLRCLQ